jgi:ribosomal protein L11 methyltransferase
MSYTEVTFIIEPPSPGSEIMMALLSENGYESFEETETGLKAYIVSDQFSEALIRQLISKRTSGFQVLISISHLPDKNWNEVWESSYAPVMIRDEIYIRAPFHEERDVKYQLLIEPKMSFGTAHHETTYMMMELMLEEDFQGKQVLDMGCGTGILAILSEMLGAKEIVAIDNDRNAYENSRENVQKNKCRFISVQYGAADLIRGEYGIILANINKNILLQDLSVYVLHLAGQGVMLLSGFYESDLDAITKKAGKLGLEYIKHQVRNQWAAVAFIKKV